MNAQVVNEWIKKAEDNYSSALTLSRRRNRPVPDVVCNQCQQCIEKYLKALLTRYKISFPKTHDLMQLEELAAPADAEIRSIHAEFLTLNPYGIDIRYPGLEASLDEAKQALRGNENRSQIFSFHVGIITGLSIGALRRRLNPSLTTGLPLSSTRAATDPTVP